MSFAQANPDGSDASISDLLRRVADTIDERKGAIVEDVVMDLAKVGGEQPNLSVYYRYPANVKPSDEEKRSEMKRLIVRSASDKEPNDFCSLVEMLDQALASLGNIDIYDVTLDNYFNDDGDEQYALTLYYDLVTTAQSGHIKQMTSKDERYLVEFELSSSTITPGEISKKTGLKPTFALDKGEEIRHKKTGAIIRKAETNRWEIASDLPPGGELEAQFEQLLEKLRPHKEYLVGLLKKAECVWEISGHSYDVSGEVWLKLSAAVLQELNDYHCQIVVDVYWRGR